MTSYYPSERELQTDEQQTEKKKSTTPLSLQRPRVKKEKVLSFKDNREMRFLQRDKVGNPFFPDSSRLKERQEHRGIHRSDEATRRTDGRSRRKSDCFSLLVRLRCGPKTFGCAWKRRRRRRKHRHGIDSQPTLARSTTYTTNGFERKEEALRLFTAVGKIYEELFSFFLSRPLKQMQPAKKRLFQSTNSLVSVFWVFSPLFIWDYDKVTFGLSFSRVLRHPKRFLRAKVLSV